MEKASSNLPALYSDPGAPPIYFLTGKKFFYQTLFCIHSLIKQGGMNLRFILVDDGTFDTALRKRVASQLPGAELITSELIEDNLNRYLPEHQYPVLRQKRKVYPHIKKLTDIHTIPGDEWKLVLDSDMLFWRRPTEMLDWTIKPGQPIHMLDCVESYGYTIELMEELCKSVVPRLLNVGAIGMKSTAINWIEVNQWVEMLEAREGTSYYLEQALTAMIIGNQKTSILGRQSYIVNPEKFSRGDILHHYVDKSKKMYFQSAWKKLITE